MHSSALTRVAAPTLQAGQWHTLVNSQGQCSHNFAAHPGGAAVVVVVGWQVVVVVKLVQEGISREAALKTAIDYVFKMRQPLLFAAGACLLLLPAVWSIGAGAGFGAAVRDFFADRIAVWRQCGMHLNPDNVLWHSKQ